MDYRRPVEAVIGGARGRLLAALVETTAPLTLRRLARLAEVSPAQASRVMPALVELGIVERYEVPPASQFVLIRENAASQAIIGLAGSRRTALRQIGDAAIDLQPAPMSMIVFGSFARNEADADSDIDIVVVRPNDLDEDDERWSDSIEGWRRQVASITGNDVEVVEASASEASRKLRGRSELWRDIRRDGVVVPGAKLVELMEPVEA